jgi:hypothetical protein
MFADAHARVQSQSRIVSHRRSALLRTLATYLHMYPHFDDMHASIFSHNMHTFLFYTTYANLSLYVVRGVQTCSCTCTRHAYRPSCFTRHVIFSAHGSWLRRAGAVREGHTDRCQNSCVNVHSNQMCVCQHSYGCIRFACNCTYVSAYTDTPGEHAAFRAAENIRAIKSRTLL